MGGGLVGRKTGIAAFVVILAASATHHLRTKTLAPVLEISTGKLQGFVTHTREGREVHEYLGIPYAKDPVGDLRFAPSQPAEPWSGIHDATISGSQCTQVSLISLKVEGSEKCLNLNVYTPASRDGPLPVMVWFHGGGFVYGHSNRYKPAYLLDEGVILVTPNYRLSTLGFLNTGDEVVRGNMGLRDQNLALKWVQKNIKYFGGDPSQVTIFGESAGSISVGFHILSPMSKGLFKNAIMQSGSPLASWLVNKNPAKQARDFAARLNCTDGSTKEMVACMRKVDDVTLVSTYQKSLFPLSDSTTLFAPTIESINDSSAFLAEEPEELLKTGRFNKVPVITGVNKDEGTLFSAVIYANQTKLRQANDEWNYYAPRLLTYDTERADLSQKIRKFYFGPVTDIDSQDLIQNYTNVFSDRHFFHPTQRFAKLYASHAPLRMYFYDYDARLSLSDLLPFTQNERLPVYASAAWEIISRWTLRRMGRDVPHFGICHGDEVQLIFQFPLSQYMGEDERDAKMSKLLLKLWTDFSKGRDQLSINDVLWPTINPKDSTLQYLTLNHNPKMEPESFTDRMRFWDSIEL